MESALLGLLRQASAEQLCREIQLEAKQQQKAAASALGLFTFPSATLIVQSKEDYWNLSKAERQEWQRNKEEERCRLNKEAGIDGKALLTKENVDAWRAQGLTFAAIARDIVGVPCELVAAATKSQPFIKTRVYAKKTKS